jgi:hypothetical protein
MQGFIELLLASSSLLTSSGPPLTSHQIFPNTTYPGYDDPATDAGAKSYQSSPPFYPTPWMSGQGDWADAYTQAKDFVSQLTLLEKVNLTTGVGWGTFFSFHFFLLKIFWTLYIFPRAHCISPVFPTG